MITFNQHMLKVVHREVKFHFPDINLRKDAYVMGPTFGQYEFFGPDDFYWHGNAEDKYHARSLGWEAWLAKQGVEDEVDY